MWSGFKVCPFRDLPLLLLGNLDDHVHVWKMREGQSPSQTAGITDYLYLFITDSLASSKRRYSFRPGPVVFPQKLSQPCALQEDRRKGLSELDR